MSKFEGRRLFGGKAIASVLICTKIQHGLGGGTLSNVQRQARSYSAYTGPPNRQHNISWIITWWTLRYTSDDGKTHIVITIALKIVSETWRQQ